MNDITNMQPPQGEESIDFQKWIGKILANWYWFLLSVILFGGAAYLITRFTEPTYRVEATILVKQEQQSMGAEALFQDLDLFGTKKNVQNEIGILKSWTIIRRALDQVNFDITYRAVGRLGQKHLYDYVPFRVTLGEGQERIFGRTIEVKILNENDFKLYIKDLGIDVKHSFNQPYKGPGFSFIVSRNPKFDKENLPIHLRADSYEFVVNNLDRLAYSYQRALTVELADRLGTLLRLSIEGPHSQQTVDFLNALMKEYIQSGLEQKNQTAANTVKFIDEQLTGIVDTLKFAEQSLQDFRSRNQVIDISAEGTAIMNEIERLSQEKALIDIQVQYYEYLLNYLKNNENFTNVMAPSTMGINDQMLTTLITTLVTLSSEKASLKYSLEENSSVMEKVTLQIKANQETLMENVRNLLQTSKLNQADVNRRISRVNTRISVLPATERQLANITRKFELSNQIYTFLLQRRAEAGIAEASNVPDHMIVDEARTDASKVVSPKTTIIYAIGLLLGLLIPLLILILRDVLNLTIEEKSDVEKLTKVPIIGTVGHNKYEEILPVIKHTRSSIAESFRAIRTNLQFSLYGEEKEVVMVTSSTSGEGKSFIALNLAGIFSVTGKRAVVVGLDLRKPTVQKYMAIQNKEGVSTYIIGRSSLESIVVPTEFPNLFVVPSGPVPPNPAELFERQQFNVMIEELKQKFDIVILDTPPVALVTDAMLISKFADATLYVVRQKYTLRTAIGFVEDLKKREHIKNLSIVINDVIVPKYYGYKYGYGYGYGYGKGYGSGYYTDDPK